MGYSFLNWVEYLSIFIWVIKGGFEIFGADFIHRRSGSIILEPVFDPHAGTWTPSAVLSLCPFAFLGGSWKGGHMRLWRPSIGSYSCWTSAVLLSWTSALYGVNTTYSSGFNDTEAPYAAYGVGGDLKLTLAITSQTLPGQQRRVQCSFKTAEILIDRNHTVALHDQVSFPLAAILFIAV